MELKFTRDKLLEISAYKPAENLTFPVWNQNSFQITQILQCQRLTILIGLFLF